MRPMRRKDRQVSSEDAVMFLKSANYGTLGMVTSDNMPYVVPVNYVYMNDAIYIHCANSGFKLDNIAYNPNVCFNAVAFEENDEPNFTTRFDSVTVFGKAEICENKEEVLIEFVKRFSPNYHEAGLEEIRMFSKATTILKVSIDHITGKSSKENKQ